MERTLEDAALRCIQAHVAAGSAFTAYNITCRLQAEGRSERHGDIRPVVHALWRAGRIGPGYARSRFQLDGGAEALVYHPRGMPPQSA